MVQERSNQIQATTECGPEWDESVIPPPIGGYYLLTEELKRAGDFTTSIEHRPDGCSWLTFIDDEAKQSFEAGERERDPQRWPEPALVPKPRRRKRMTYDQRVADIKQSMEDMLAKEGWCPDCHCERCKENRAKSAARLPRTS